MCHRVVFLLFLVVVNEVQTADEPLFDDCMCYHRNPDNPCCFMDSDTTTEPSTTTNALSSTASATSSTPSQSSCAECNEWKWIGIGAAAMQVFNAAGVILLLLAYRRCKPRPRPGDYAAVPSGESNRSPSSNRRTATTDSLVGNTSTNGVGNAPTTPTSCSTPSSSYTAMVPSSSATNESSVTGITASPTVLGSPAPAASQSIPPGDITTQPGTKIVFNGPYDDKHTYHIKITNAGGRRIGWAIKATNMKRLGVDPPCGVLDPKEAVLMAVSCDSFAYGQEDTNNDRITIEWTNTPDGAAKQFRREWFQGDGMVRRKNLPIEYNP